jgi:hypothetical protein
MTRKTIATLLAQADATLADNTTGDISAADVRDMIKDLINSIKPGYGAAGNDSLTIVGLGTTPRVISYNQLLAQTPEDFLVLLGAGQIQRLANGLPLSRTRLSFQASVLAPAGNEILLSVYRNGIDMPGGVTISATGLGNPQSAVFQSLDVQPVPADPVYEVRASKITGAASDVEFTDVRLLLEVVPTLVNP